MRVTGVCFIALIPDGIAYGSAPDASGNPQTLTLDMYRPAGDTQTSRPAIVLVHGGGFKSGTSKAGNMVAMANAFAQRGYVAVSINYRLLDQSGEKCGDEDPASQNCVNAALAATHDAQAAIRFLRRYAGVYGIDPWRIAIGGASAGAATALAVAVDSGEPGTSGNPGYSSKAAAAISISGALPHSTAAAYYDSGDSPTLMFNGTADKTVPYAAAQQTAADLQHAGIPVVFDTLNGAGHVPFSTYGTYMIQQSLYFSYLYLDLADAAGQPTTSPTAAITSPRSGSTYTLGQAVTTSFSCTEGNAGPGLDSCTDSRGAKVPSGSLDTGKPGVYTYTVTAVSKDGRRGTATLTYTVRPPTPVLSQLKLAPARFRAAKRGRTVIRSGRNGTRITYRDTLAARTTFKVYRRASGIRRGRRCVAPPHRRRRGERHCARLVLMGSFTHADRTGANRLRFSGRLRGHTLHPGSYLLKAQAVRQGQKSRTVSASFRVRG